MHKTPKQFYITRVNESTDLSKGFGIEKQLIYAHDLKTFYLWDPTAVDPPDGLKYFEPLNGGRFVGFAVGIADRDALITGATITPGDVLIGLPSQNLRSNGFSLARRVLLERAQLPLDGPAYPGAHHTLADELLAPSVIYSPAIATLQAAVDVRGVAHITGGGIPGNLNRVLPHGTAAEVTWGTWEVPPIFGEIQRLGSVTDDEMARVFNMGVGMIVVVPEADVFKSLDVARAAGHRANVIGQIIEGDGTVRIV